MTLEEEQEFKNKIAETIIPIVSSMTEEQIKSIITTVQNENPSLPEGFGTMLYEQILLIKYGLSQ